MNKYFIKDKFNIKLELIDRNKKIERIIVKNGVSKYGFIAIGSSAIVMSTNIVSAYGFENVYYYKRKKADPRIK